MAFGGEGSESGGNWYLGEFLGVFECLGENWWLLMIVMITCAYVHSLTFIRVYWSYYVFIYALRVFYTFLCIYIRF